MCEVWHRSVVTSVRVSSKIIMVKFKLEEFKICVVIIYDPSEVVMRNDGLSGLY